MPSWTPEQLWRGREAIIIGGGPSLSKFDWSQLHGRLTIGCNSAYTLGRKVCSICIFGDLSFYQRHKEHLEASGIPCFTNAPGLQHLNLPWLYTVPRAPWGLSSGKLAWNANTGAAAINLAILLGAIRIFLLGYDMKMGAEKKSNWHPGSPRNNDETYVRFNKEFQRLVQDWKEKFSHVEIVNVTDDSNLEGFPKVPVNSIFKGRST